jgi:hypothetical protein
MATKNLTKGLTRIGKGYYPTAYGRGFQKNATVYLIDGKAWVRGTEYHEVKDGFIRVNFNETFNRFSQIGAIEKHLDYIK